MFRRDLPKIGCRLPDIEGDKSEQDGDPILNLAGIVRFVDRCRGVSTLEELGQLVAAQAGDQNFRWFGVHECLEAACNWEMSRWLTNIPPEVWSASVSPTAYRNDPFVRAIMTSNLPLVWDDVRRTLTEEGSQSRLLTCAEEYGLVHGVTFPLHVPGEHVGTLTFASDASPISMCSIAAMVLTGPEIILRARQIRRGAKFPTADRDTMLTPRQRDCLILIAKGKSDWEAGKILGLSAQTIHGHIEAIRTRYGVRRRTQLVLRALYFGEISFEEIF